ncbi:alpha/beta fold hydrolase [Nocardia sp. NPDC020380]|uniref:alpha/beta fold hydrolase n=1 Tax=Nocardia sp. NPDC020380 TaxID=3364309 RepID=UPI00379C11AA
MEINRFAGLDGAELVFREIGAGRPLILLHSFMGSGTHGLVDWAHLFAEQGRRVVLPDFRGHGDSAKSHDRAAYPPDVLADDELALIEYLGGQSQTSPANLSSGPWLSARGRG